MVLTLVVSMLAVMLLIGTTGLCSFEPGRPENGPVQEADPESFTRIESASIGFQLVNPQVRDGWVPNSARRSSLGDELAAVLGYLTANEGYLQLTQSAASVEDGAQREGRERTDTREVAGREVQVFHSEEFGVRDIWAIDHGDRRAFITGAADDAEWMELVEAYDAGFEK